MPAYVVEQGARSSPAEVEAYAELKARENNRLAVGGCRHAGGKSKKRTLDEMQSDSQMIARKTVEDTPDRTSSEDEQQRRDNLHAIHVDAGLPPMVPTKVPPKSSIAAKQDTAKGQHQQNRITTMVGVIDGDRLRESPKSPVATTKTKLKKAKTSKKAASKPEQERRRKRKENDASSATEISQASAKMLFQCSCQLLRTQALEYDVRAREMEERNATQAKEIEEWEKKIRSLKRELEEYADEQPSSDTAGLALIETGPGAFRASGEEENPLPAMATAAALGATTAVESSLPPSVLAAEAKLQEALRKRAQKVNEFCRSVPGFIDSLDKQAPF